MAKRDVAGIVAGAGLLTGIFTELVQAVRELGGTDEDIHRLATPDGRATIDQMADLIVCKLEVGPYFRFVVDYTMSRAQMVAAGHYVASSPNITEENFPVGSGRFSVEAVLVHSYLSRYLTNDQVSRDLRLLGLRDATMDEGLAFAAKYPDEQLKFPIVIRGSDWTSPQGGLNVGYLWEELGNRKLYLFQDDNKWTPNCRFLAVPVSK